MALLQISEPGQAPAPHQHRLAAGIDLGTTNSLIATVRSGLAETLPDQNQQHLLPSVVYYGEQNIKVGKEAKDLAEQQPQQVISSAKRMIGRQLTDLQASHYAYQFQASENGLPLIKTAQGLVNPIRVSADILKTLAQRAEKTLGGELSGVVITVPAYFDDAQRQATKEAASLAGLHVLRLLNEPTAAAVAYGLDSQQEGVIAVYDLGGGTFDISVLRLNKGVFEVLATGGDSALGGDDFDQAIVDYFREQHAAWQNNDDPHLHQRLRNLANSVKTRLSSEECVNVILDGVDLTLTRAQFEQCIMPYVKRTLLACRRALKDAGVAPDEVQQVVMVGGSTRVPVIRQRVGEFFGTEPLTSIDPDRVVAIGAAIQADILVGNKLDSEMLLLDVIPLSLGLEVMGELVEKIIPRNTTIPCARAQEFTTFKDGQTAMMIHVLQGERETVKECRSLAHFTLRDIPPMPAGGAHIRVTFQVDADGLLSVSAMEKSTGVQAAVQVKPAFGLTDTEITTMIEDSLRHAQEDMQWRKLAEAKVEAARVLESVINALALDRHLLVAEEAAVIDQAVAQLQQSVQGDDANAIHFAIKQVDYATQDFAARRMDESIRRALSGHSVDEL